MVFFTPAHLRLFILAPINCFILPRVSFCLVFFAKVRHDDRSIYPRVWCPFTLSPGHSSIGKLNVSSRSKHLFRGHLTLNCQYLATLRRRNLETNENRRSLSVTIVTNMKSEIRVSPCSNVKIAVFCEIHIFDIICTIFFFSFRLFATVPERLQL